MLDFLQWLADQPKARLTKQDREGDAVRTLKYESIRSARNGLVSLWEQQKNRGIEGVPEQNPVGPLVRSFLTTTQKKTDTKRRQDYEDRGKNTIMDGYMAGHMKQICDFLWSGGLARSTGALCENGIGLDMRTLADFLMRHHMLLRGQSTRDADLSDLFTLELEGEGVTKCMPLIMQMGHG